MAGGGRGKRGGYRIIYLVLLSRSVIAFLDGYSKSVQEDLTAEDLKRLVARIAPVEAQAIQLLSAPEEPHHGKAEKSSEHSGEETPPAQ
jgi:hypothetical protein